MPRAGLVRVGAVGAGPVGVGPVGAGPVRLRPTECPVRGDLRSTEAVHSRGSTVDRVQFHSEELNQRESVAEVIIRNVTIMIIMLMVTSAPSHLSGRTAASDTS